jgi:hypothetical protein
MVYSILVARREREQHVTVIWVARMSKPNEAKLSGQRESVGM